MTPEAFAALRSLAEAGKTAAPVALMAAAAALPHLLAQGRAAAPVRIAPGRPRRAWGREDGFTLSGPRR